MLCWASAGCYGAVTTKQQRQKKRNSLMERKNRGRQSSLVLVDTQQSVFCPTTHAAGGLGFSESNSSNPIGNRLDGVFPEWEGVNNSSAE